MENINQRHAANKQAEVFGFPEPNSKPSPFKFHHSGDERLTGEGAMLSWDAAKIGVKQRLRKRSAMDIDMDMDSEQSIRSAQEELFPGSMLNGDDSYAGDSFAIDPKVVFASNMSATAYSFSLSTPESPSSILKKKGKTLKKKLSVRFASQDDFLSPSPVSPTFPTSSGILDAGSSSHQCKSLKIKLKSLNSIGSSRTKNRISTKCKKQYKNPRNFVKSTHPLSCTCSTCVKRTCPIATCRKVCSVPGDLRRHKSVHTRALAMKCRNPACSASKETGHARSDSLKRHCKSQMGIKLGCYEWNKPFFEEEERRTKERRKEMAMKRRKERKIELSREMKEEIMAE